MGTRVSPLEVLRDFTGRDMDTFLRRILKEGYSHFRSYSSPVKRFTVQQLPSGYFEIIGKHHDGHKSTFHFPLTEIIEMLEKMGIHTEEPLVVWK